MRIYTIFLSREGKALKYWHTGDTPKQALTAFLAEVYGVNRADVQLCEISMDDVGAETIGVRTNDTKPKYYNIANIVQLENKREQLEKDPNWRTMKQKLLIAIHIEQFMGNNRLKIKTVSRNKYQFRLETYSEKVMEFDIEDSSNLTKVSVSAPYCKQTEWLVKPKDMKDLVLFEID